MIRVLRIIEYTYDDPETAANDMSHWNAPAIGEVHIAVSGAKKRIRSTIITDLNFDSQEEIREAR